MLKMSSYIVDGIHEVAVWNDGEEKEALRFRVADGIIVLADSIESEPLSSDMESATEEKVFRGRLSK